MSESDKPRFRRVVRRDNARTTTEFMRPAELWTAIKDYFGFGRKIRQQPIDSPETLSRFLDERASFVAQTSLYGYLRTRAGMRYPELFDDDVFVASINIAKWHLWLDCLADISVFAGSRIAQHAPRELLRIAPMMTSLTENILARTGIPAEAGSEYQAHAGQVRTRLMRTDWLALGEDEAAFVASPASLVRWAPVLEELKALDEAIVLNSVRFRWQEVRRDFSQLVDLPGLLNSMSGMHEQAVDNG
jgi:hypothetical protein